MARQSYGRDVRGAESDAHISKKQRAKPSYGNEPTRVPTSQARREATWHKRRRATQHQQTLSERERHKVKVRKVARKHGLTYRAGVRPRNEKGQFV